MMMKMPRNTRAIRMPSKRTICSCSFLTFNRVKMMMKTKRLSIESEYSVIHPAKNSVLASGLSQLRIVMPKMIAAET